MLFECLFEDCCVLCCFSSGGWWCRWVFVDGACRNEKVMVGRGGYCLLCEGSGGVGGRYLV